MKKYTIPAIEIKDFNKEDIVCVSALRHDSTPRKRNGDSSIVAEVNIAGTECA